jgi:hypothetical protein
MAFQVKRIKPVPTPAGTALQHDQHIPKANRKLSDTSPVHGLAPKVLAAAAAGQAQSATLASSATAAAADALSASDASTQQVVHGPPAPLDLTYAEPNGLLPLMLEQSEQKREALRQQQLQLQLPDGQLLERTPQEQLMPAADHISSAAAVDAMSTNAQVEAGVHASGKLVACTLQHITSVEVAAGH